MDSGRISFPFIRYLKGLVVIHENMKTNTENKVEECFDEGWDANIDIEHETSGALRCKISLTKITLRAAHWSDLFNASGKYITIPGGTFPLLQTADDDPEAMLLSLHHLHSGKLIPTMITG
ncbi:hypothetical protein FGRMN_7826 [Fusarium graminum]|nr:hypothetical protein FGRMN_7826 [Fusarium graminum]